MNWPNAVPTAINSIQVIDPIAYMARLCKSRANKGGEDNYHIFLNSVEGIVKIIRLAGLSTEQCRIVCSQSKNSKDKNQEKLGEFKIETANDPVRMFNFYTSTCFEGQDIYDENGRTFIVSEPYKDHTKMDVMTTLLQICGRIRDSKLNYEIVQIFAKSPYKDITPDEFAASLQKQLEDAEHDAKLLNKLSTGGKELLKAYVNKAPYLGVDEKKWHIIVDRNLANLEIVNYGIVNGQYASQCNMNASLAKAGFKVTNNAEAYTTDVQLEEISPIAKTSFKDIFEEYVSIRESTGYNLDCFRRSRIEVEKPLVKEAYEKLGAEKVREMKYHQSNIKRELTKRMDETLDTKVFLLLDAQLPKQVAIPKSEIKAILDSIYTELKIQQKAKATDLKRWYNLKETTTKSVAEGAQSCFAIISAKVRIKQK